MGEKTISPPRRRGAEKNKTEEKPRRLGVSAVKTRFV
jgi:hypothetical protein